MSELTQVYAELFRRAFAGNPLDKNNDYSEGEISSCSE